MPVKRIIRKNTCEVCGGSGGELRTKTSTCPQCVGRGWIELGDSKEKLCPQCNGDGRIEIRAQDSCLECGGKGYEVRIMEVSTRRRKCGDCKGTGYLHPLVNCPECDGTGYEQYCNACHGKGSLDSGYLCGECGGTGMGTKLCSNCSGREKVVDTDNELCCSTCEGDGFVAHRQEIDITPAPGNQKG